MWTIDSIFDITRSERYWIARVILKSDDGTEECLSFKFKQQPTQNLVLRQAQIILDERAAWEQRRAVALRICNKIKEARQAGATIDAIINAIDSLKGA